MKRMLRKNPDVRISAEQAWSHPWIQKHMKMNPGEKNLDKAINNISTFKVTSTIFSSQIDLKQSSILILYLKSLLQMKKMP